MSNTIAQWSCSMCTFKNMDSASHCEMCNTAKTEQPVHSIQTDYELAKRLQAQYLEVDHNPPTSNANHHSNPFKVDEIHPTNSNSLHQSSESRIIGNESDNTSSNNDSESEIIVKSSRRIIRRRNNSDNSANTNSSESNASSTTFQRNRQNQRNRKRRREAMEIDDDDNDTDNDSDYDVILNDEHNNRVQFKIKDESIRWSWHGGDIVNRIGQNWIPGQSKWTNPALVNKISLTSSGLDPIESDGNPIESILAATRLNQITGARYSDLGCAFISHIENDFPFVIIDFKDINIQLKVYQIVHGYADYREYEKDGMEQWEIEGSKDFQKWSSIHQVTKDQSSAYGIRYKIHDDMGYFSKIRIKLTGPNKSGRNVLKIKYLRLYGDVRRRVYKSKARIDEMKTTPFPKIPTKRCIGDPNKVITILNNFDGIQHNDYKEYEEEIPDLKVELKDYQKRGLSWMIHMEDNGTDDGIHGGLICDEMGLGKTVQMIALMLVQRQKKRRINKKAKDRTVIITPLSLIDQWISELNKIADKKAFKMINYYGSQRKKIKKIDFEKCDVVLSTISTFANVIGKISKEWDDFESEWWTKGTKQQLLFTLPNGFFSRIVIDESHEIKNTTSKRSEIICAFAAKCDSKWCLTGTPINNDLPSDLSGMSKYLGIKHSQFVSALNLSDDERKEAQIIEKSPKWLDLNNEFCINKIKRFLKSIMIRRTKEVVLQNDFASKEEVIVNVKLNDEERVIYNKISDQALTQYKEFKTNKSVMSHYMHLMKMVTKLRKLCDHPSMVFAVNIESDIMDFALNTDVLEKLQNDIVGRINNMDSLLEYECPICFELTEINGGLISKCGHMFCLECLNELIENKPECGLCRSRFTKSNIIRIIHVLKSKKLDQKHKEEFEEFKINGSNKNNDDDNKDDYDSFVKKYSEITMSTSKTSALIDRLKHIKEHHEGDKAIVFSNFTKYLAIISKQLKNSKIKHFEFNSGLNRKKRKDILQQFKSSKDCRVLLISAKCASVGLNLMCANHVIFLDPRSNVGLDNQAIARCWRIGQTKTVYVTRFITKGTIEEKILSLQQNKTDKKVHTKRKAKLTEKDYDIIFDYNVD